MAPSMDMLTDCKLSMRLKSYSGMSPQCCDLKTPLLHIYTTVYVFKSGSAYMDTSSFEQLYHRHKMLKRYY